MPNPKTGTVTNDIANAVKEVKAGKVEFRLDKTSVIHCPVGKVSFDSQGAVENANSLMQAVVKAKPAAAKGKYVRSATICSTMGPGRSPGCIALQLEDRLAESMKKKPEKQKDMEALRSRARKGRRTSS